MPRYFLEVSYKGTAYSGFQVQKNANSIQAELEKAFSILQKEDITMTGSSRTDTGVHALQNFLHFDFEEKINPHFIYKMNAILPGDIVIKQLLPVVANAHCRFDAVSREYKYFIYQNKNPFLEDRAWYFPYKLNIEKLQKAATIIMEYEDFTSFSKRRSQVKTFICSIQESKWSLENDCLIYNVRANRFLRGMVRALVATMLLVSREKITLKEFRKIIENKDSSKANFSAPALGLFLISVRYSGDFFKNNK